jgi:putative spermidine/putrescine transport system ATP-binding protein
MTNPPGSPETRAATEDVPEVKRPGGNGNVLLDLRSLTKRFGDTTALDNVDLSVYEGEILTLLGPSGSGKTTMLRLIAGFELPTSGELLLRGRDIGHLTPAQRQIGMVFQNYALFPHLTVAQNIAYPLKLRRQPRAERRQRVREMLDLVRLPSVGDRRPNELSGGQQQRIALARALSFRPDLLLMDEPLGALDRLLRLEMEEEIRRLHREAETTIVTVTHDQQEALALSDRIAIMRDGRVVGLGVPEELYYSPPIEFVAGFFSNANLLSATIEQRFDDGTGMVACAGTQLRLPIPGDADKIVVAVRTNAFTLLAPDSTSSLTLDGVVVESILMGGERELTVDLGELGVVKALVDTRLAGSGIGAPIRLCCAATDLAVSAREQ